MKLPESCGYREARDLAVRDCNWVLYLVCQKSEAASEDYADFRLFSRGGQYALDIIACLVDLFKSLVHNSTVIII